jgi:hypothetical protein
LGWGVSVFPPDTITDEGYGTGDSSGLVISTLFFVPQVLILLMTVKKWKFRFKEEIYATVVFSSTRQHINT